MTRRVGTVVLFVILLLLWGTPAAAPFRAFSEMARDASAAIAGFAGLTGFALALAVLASSSVLLCVLLLAGRSRWYELAAGVCALAGAVWHMAGRLGDRTFSATSTAITIGLAVVLVLLLLKARSANLRLGDAFTASITVMIVYDAAILPAMARFGLSADRLPGWLDIGGKSFTGAAGSPAGVPAWIAGLVPAAVAVAVTIILSRRRDGSRT